MLPVSSVRFGKYSVAPLSRFVTVRLNACWSTVRSTGGPWSTSMSRFPLAHAPLDSEVKVRPSKVTAAAAGSPAVFGAFGTRTT